MCLLDGLQPYHCQHASYAGNGRNVNTWCHTIEHSIAVCLCHFSFSHCPLIVSVSSNPLFFFCLPSVHIYLGFFCFSRSLLSSPSVLSSPVFFFLHSLSVSPHPLCLYVSIFSSMSASFSVISIFLSLCFCISLMSCSLYLSQCLSVHLSLSVSLYLSLSHGRSPLNLFSLARQFFLYLSCQMVIFSVKLSSL